MSFPTCLPLEAAVLDSLCLGVELTRALGLAPSSVQWSAAWAEIGSSRIQFSGGSDSSSQISEWIFSLPAQIDLKETAIFS